MLMLTSLFSADDSVTVTEGALRPLRAGNMDMDVSQTALSFRFGFPMLDLFHSSVIFRQRGKREAYGIWRKVDKDKESFHQWKQARSERAPAIKPEAATCIGQGKMAR